MKPNALTFVYFFLFFITINTSLLYSQCSPDTEPPVAICELSVNLALPTSGSLALDPAFFDAGSFDNCTTPENLSFSVLPTSVSCANIGTPVNVILTVADEAGNSNSCQTMVIVEDKTGPLLVCETQVNISIPPSGEVILTPELLLNFYEDNCDLTFDISPPSVNCGDIGAPINYTITATDAGGNSNSCNGVLVVEDKSAFTLACFSNINVTLPASGVLMFTPAMLEAFNDDNCDLTYSISPSQVDCGDVGTTVVVSLSATDPGGNFNLCTSEVFVLDSEPTMVNIIPPSSIGCGESGVIFNSSITGGFGPYIYEWVIKKGASSGWAITSGQGTSAITVNTGIGKLKLDLEVQGVCGGKVKDKYKFTPDCETAIPAMEKTILIADSEQLGKKNLEISEKEDLQLVIYPNPVFDELNFHLLNSRKGTTEIRIYNNLGKMIMAIPSSSMNFSLIHQVNDWPGGIYFLEVKMENGKRVIEKFIKS